MLTPTTQLHTHHVEENGIENFNSSFAVVEKDFNGFGPVKLRNLSQQKWIIVKDSGTRDFVLPGKSIPLRNGLRISFAYGRAEAEVYSSS